MENNKEKFITLGDVCSITKLAGFEFSQYFKYKNDGEIIAIRALNVKNGVLDLNDIKRVSKETSEKLERSKLRIGDIVLTYTGSLGQVAFITENDKYHLAPNVCLLRPEKIDPYFLYSFMRTKIFKKEIEKYKVGSTQSTVPMKNVRLIECRNLDKTDQKNIGSFSSFFDRKIELNKKNNEILEEIAKTVFKSWFIDFDPVQAKLEGRSTGLPDEISDLFPDSFEDSELGKIPQGWEIKSLDEISDFLNGLALQKFPATSDSTKYPVLKIAQLRVGHLNNQKDFASNIPEKYIVRNGDYIFAWSASLLSKFWLGGDAALNQHLFKVTSKKYPSWFFSKCIENHMKIFKSIAASKVTSMGHIKRKDLKDATNVVPSLKLISSANKYFVPLIEKANICILENYTLENLRDTLLPKLISGKLKISEAEKIIDEVNL